MAALGLWVRSYWVETRIQRSHRELRGQVHIEREHRLTSRRGRLYISASSSLTELLESLARQRAAQYAQSGGPELAEWRSEEIRPPVPWGVPGRWGFAYRTTEKSYRSVFGPHTGRSFLIMFPWGVILAVLGVMPVWWLLGLRQDYRRKKRRLNGLCAGCGYDLRSTPDRCPECGQTTAGLAKAVNLG
jgi:hypothetical protein